MQTQPPAIIDCHIHPAAGPDTNLGWFQRYAGTTEQVDALRRLGITRACGAPVQPLPPGSFAGIRALNDAALTLRDRFPDFYIPGIHVHPHFPEESCAEIARCCGGEGVRWIGELVGYMTGYGNDYATDDALRIFREAARHRAVVNFHCDDLDVIARLCRGVPDAAFVLAHPGAKRTDFLQRLELVARLPNLYLDLSGSGIDRLGIVRHCIDTAGREKLLFGSDFPINNPAVYLHGVLFETLTEAEREAIFSGNFCRLTGFSA
jgi:predicted TIM-barrel fold metal-dependent hydrolase